VHEIAAEMGGNQTFAAEAEDSVLAIKAVIQRAQHHHHNQCNLGEVLRETVARQVLAATSGT
jgi:hypothetical protein